MRSKPSCYTPLADKMLGNAPLVRETSILRQPCPTAAWAGAAMKTLPGIADCRSEQYAFPIVTVRHFHDKVTPADAAASAVAHANAADVLPEIVRGLEAHL